MSIQENLQAELAKTVDGLSFRIQDEIASESPSPTQINFVTNDKKQMGELSALVGRALAREDISKELDALSTVKRLLVLQALTNYLQRQQNQE